MASPSISRRVHLAVNTKRFIADLTDSRKMDFFTALERLAENPTVDGDSKISIEGFPYQPGTCAFASHGFILTYYIRDHDSIGICAARNG
jgi:hypothetical protein